MKEVRGQGPGPPEVNLLGVPGPGSARSVAGRLRGVAGGIGLCIPPPHPFTHMASGCWAACQHVTGMDGTPGKSEPPCSPLQHPGHRRYRGEVPRRSPTRWLHHVSVSTSCQATALCFSSVLGPLAASLHLTASFQWSSSSGHGGMLYPPQ